ncbi:alpha/beta hydrolase [Streptomyces sp. NPDC046977]|uniref:alpha/beta fold hydrolase n=1 Tax=Streptomyces sp. NPDC046977 TaxID=3154703 RepID=UPI0033E0C120
MNTGAAPLTYAGLHAERHGEADGRPPLVLLHGLSYDHRQWGPVLHELEICDPGRSVLVLNLPGHGESSLLDRHGHDDVAAVVYQAVSEAGLATPVVVGYSLGGAVATAYAATYPTHSVVNIDQPLRIAGFAEMLQRNEHVLRSPQYATIWGSLLGRMGIDTLPPQARALARPAAVPPQELLLSYWEELLTTPLSELQDRHTSRLARIASQGTPYHYLAGGEPDPEYRTWLRIALPQVEISVLDGSGHFPHLAHPGAVARILASYTRQNGAKWLQGNMPRVAWSRLAGSYGD